MAKKRRKPRNRQGVVAPTRSGKATSATGVASGPAREPRPSTERAGSERAARKEMARLERDRARRRVARTRAIRRGVTLATMAGVVGVGAFLIFRVGGPGAISAAALEAGRAAGCGDVQTPAASAAGGLHLASGESANYTTFPASSGIHDSSPLPPDPAVYTQPVSEEAAVHNLEHGYVVMYYRADGPDALPDEVVQRLAQIANGQDKVLLAPHEQLEEGTSLALVAWNKVWACPSSVSAADSATMATSFIEAYKGTSNAPEGNVP